MVDQLYGGVSKEKIEDYYAMHYGEMAKPETTDQGLPSKQGVYGAQNRVGCFHVYDCTYA